MKAPHFGSYVCSKLRNNQFQYSTTKRVNVNKLIHIQQGNRQILGFSGSQNVFDHYWNGGGAEV